VRMPPARPRETPASKPDGASKPGGTSKPDAEGGLSLVELMESLEPRERPVDPEATLYYPIDERHARAAAATPPFADTVEPVVEPAVPPAIETPSAVEPPPKPPGARRPLDSLANASLVQKAIIVLLPCLMAMFGLTPVLEPEAPIEPAPAATAQPKPAPEPEPMAALVPPPLQAPRVQRPAIAPGTSVERAAADHVASGDFAGALELYRELAETRSDAAVFAEAARILERRARHAKASP
jgi:hypothetical protein